MEQNKVKDIVIFFIVSIITIIFIIVGYNICKSNEDANTGYQSEEIYYKAKVVSITEVKANSYNDFVDLDNSIELGKTIYFKAKLQNGPNKGEVVDIIQNVDYSFAYNAKDVSEGDEIIIIGVADTTTGEITWNMVEHNKINYLIWLLVLFFALLIIIGRLKGFTTIIALIYSTLIIFAVYIPSILKGYNIYLSTSIIATFIIFMSMLIINGANKKTLCAIVGNIGGIAVAGVLGLVFNKLIGITGIIDEQSVFLKNYNEEINLPAIVWGGFLIGALGAIMDISMTIASAMNELAEKMKNKNFGEMLKSGMNIGRDGIGTMTTTLVLAYIGSSLATVLLLIAYSKNMIYLFNIEMIIVDVMQAIIGSIGILFAVPITALFSAYIYNRE